MNLKTKLNQLGSRPSQSHVSSLGHKRCTVGFEKYGSIIHFFDGKQKVEHILVFEKFHDFYLLPGKRVPSNSHQWDKVGQPPRESETSEQLGTSGQFWQVVG